MEATFTVLVSPGAITLRRSVMCQPRQCHTYLRTHPHRDPVLPRLTTIVTLTRAMVKPCQVLVKRSCLKMKPLQSRDAKDIDRVVVEDVWPIP